MKEIHEAINLAITNQLIALLTRGIAPWKKGWNVKDSKTVPFNVISNRAYEGGLNRMILRMAAGGRIPAFGCSSKRTPNVKGAEGIYILKPNFFKTEDKITGEEKLVLRSFSYLKVFHYSDLRGIDHAAIEKKFAEPVEDSKVFNVIEEAERIINNMPNCPKIKHNGGNSAFYRPSTDSVHMPEKVSFHSENEYYATLFHEVAHSTGHFTRLDRKEGMNNIRFGSHDYSFEELVAELTACFVGSECGIMNDAQMENSAAYLKSWIKTFQSNTDWIIKASGLANKASNYILNKNKKEETKDEEVAA